MYLTLKTLHVISVVLFLGNITTGLFWHRHALRTGDPKLLAHTMAGIIRSDRLFTTPGVLGILITGIAAAVHAGLPIIRTPWIFWTIILFVISGAIFGMRIAPLQRRLHAMASDAAAFDAAGYHALSRTWQRWGLVATITPAIGIVLMVLKPTF